MVAVFAKDLQGNRHPVNISVVLDRDELVLLLGQGAISVVFHHCLPTETKRIPSIDSMSMRMNPTSTQRLRTKALGQRVSNVFGFSFP